MIQIKHFFYEKFDLQKFNYEHFRSNCSLDIQKTKGAERVRNGGSLMKNWLQQHQKLKLTFHVKYIDRSQAEAQGPSTTAIIENEQVSK